MAFRRFYRPFSEGVNLLYMVIGIAAGSIAIYVFFVGGPPQPTGMLPEAKGQIGEEHSSEAQSRGRDLAGGEDTTGRETTQGAEADTQLPGPIDDQDLGIHQVRPGSPVQLQGLQTTVAVKIHSVGGEEFATFTVTPPGNEPIVQPYFGAERDIEFTALGNAYRLRILGVDIDERVARFDVSPEN